MTITAGIITLLLVVIIGDYIIAVETGREVNAEIITLMKMSITGLIGIIGGFIGGRATTEDSNNE